MTDLRISPELSLPLEVAGEALAILAKRGAGKTNTATVLVEELVKADVQTVILDPVGAWWGIRSGADGESPGLEVARLGGTHGDVPLEQTAGALIADVAVDSGQSLLIDLSDLPTKAAVGRFVTDFAERLYRRKGKDDSVLHLVLEEADSFAPQRVKGSERMQGAIEQLVRRGRARGIGVTLITQRSAVLSKDVLTQADVLIVMRTTGPHDVRAIKEWVDARGDEAGAEVIASLPSLATGEAWVWNPERELLSRVKIRARKTFDSSRTPRAGERRAEPKNAASIDIDKLGEQIRATAEKVRAEDPAALKRQIASLQRELAAKPSGKTVERIVEKPIEVLVEIPAVSQDQVNELTETANTMRELSRTLVARADQIEEALRHVERPRAEQVERREVARAEVRPRPNVAPARRPAPPAVDSDTILGGGEQKILDSLASHYPMKTTRAQLGTLSGYAHKGGTFTKYFGILKKAGLLQEISGEISVTEAGLEYLGDEIPEPKSPEEMLAMWRDALEGGPRKLLDELALVYPDSLTRHDLGERTDYEASGGTFTKYLGILKRNDLVTTAGGEVRASDALFIGARA